MGSEDRKVQKFIDGLRPAIRSRLAPFDISTYEEAVHRAQLCEQDYERNVSETGKFSRSRDRDRKRSDRDRFFRRGVRLSDKRPKIEEVQERTDRPPVHPALPPARGIVIGGPRPTTDRCRRCGRYHGTRPCPVPIATTVVCYRCGRPGHVMRDCPERQDTAPQKGKELERAPVQVPAQRRRATAEEKGKQVMGTGRVHALDQDTADQSSDVVKGTIQIFDLEAYVLIDPGATHSFVSPSFACKLSKYVKSIPLSSKLLILTPINTSQLVEYVVRDCKLKVGEKEMSADLIVMYMRDFDVILGMDCDVARLKATVLYLTRNRLHC